MHLSSTELEVLFEHENLLFSEKQKLVVAVPIDSYLTDSQTQLLKKIIAAMGFSHSSYSWIYYECGNENISIEQIIQCFSPNLIIRISSKSSEFETSNQLTKDGITLLTLPHPEKMDNDERIKRDVWKVLKPFSIH